MSGLCIPVRRNVPLPAMERSVSGRSRRIRRRVSAPRPNKNQKIERNPRNCVRIPPKTGPIDCPIIRTSGLVTSRATQVEATYCHRRHR